MLNLKTIWKEKGDSEIMNAKEYLIVWSPFNRVCNVDLFHSNLSSHALWHQFMQKPHASVLRCMLEAAWRSSCSSARSLSSQQKTFWNKNKLLPPKQGHVWIFRRLPAWHLGRRASSSREPQIQDHCREGVTHDREDESGVMCWTGTPPLSQCPEWFQLTLL